MTDFLQTFIAALGAAILAVLVSARLPKNNALGAAQRRSQATIIDSNALIDGRIVDLVKLGFVSQTVIVPEFIVAELQLLADGNDSQKRERARYGLEVVQQLQSLDSSQVRISKINPEHVTIDDKLVALALQERASLFTNDFNLNQVASIKGVQVLNINELSHALRPHVLPGEQLKVSIVQAGSNRDQGVGYLDDGTMIVVDGAKRDIGKVVPATVTRSHQTVAGKMIFARRDAVKTEPIRPEPKVQTPRMTAHPAKPQQQHPRRSTSSKRQTQPQAVRQNPPRQNRRLSHRDRAEQSLLSAIDNQND